MDAQSIALPIDIPWKRLTVSADMIDTSFGDSSFPPRWRSSIAVFYHEPEAIPEGYCDRRITYFKVCCSITGYQLDQKEVGFEFDPDGRSLVAVPIVVWARGSQAENVWPKMALMVNGTWMREWDVDDPTYRPYVSSATLIRGLNTIEIAFLNDLWTEGGDRNLYVDRVAIGPRVLSPLEPGVLYNRRDANGCYQTAGQREMFSQGELLFSFDYQPQDWMSQLVEEYDSIAAYLPCYGALLHVGVYPRTAVKTEVRRVRVTFAASEASDVLANPLEVGAVRFRVPGAGKNVIADVPGSARSLGLGQQLTATFPATSRVESKLSSGSNLTIEAMNGEVRVGTRSVQSLGGQSQSVIFEGQEIDRLIFRAVQNEAWLAELIYDTTSVEDIGPEDFPYVLDFEPKKRELYEAVTETGEQLSRSSTNLNLRKGTTDTNSLEDVDIFQGAQGGFKVGFGPGVGFEGSGGGQGQWGTRTVSGAEHVNLRTTDDSREKRETFSHSTTLSQLYHLFNGYHLGTNRSLFFMLPRPHVTEIVEDGRAARTFVKGPRRLEGVQEVFLVVNRPRGVSSICVEALLETAHLNWEVEENIQEGQVQEPKLPTTHELEVYLTDKYREKAFPYYHSDDEETYHFVVIRYYWDPASGTFLTEAYRQEKTSVSTSPGLGAKTYEDALAEYQRDNPVPAVPPPDPVRTIQTHTQMILTARSAKGCLPENGRGPCAGESAVEPLPADGDREWVSMETDVPMGAALTQPSAHVTSKARASNQLINTIGRKLISSLGSRERYAKGEVDFLETKFALSRLRQKLAMMPDNDPHNQPIAKLGQIDSATRVRLLKAFPEARRRKDALAIPLRLLRERLGLSETEARRLQLQLIGIIPASVKVTSENPSTDKPPKAHDPSNQQAAPKTGKKRSRK